MLFLISIDLLDFPLHFLYKYKGNQANRGKSRKSAVLEGNSKLKSTYLSEFLTDFKISKDKNIAFSVYNSFLALRTPGNERKTSQKIPEATQQFRENFEDKW